MVVEFQIQLDNERDLHVDKSTQTLYEDYIQMNIDLKHDRGKVYTGPVREKNGVIHKPNVTFVMKDGELFKLVDRELGAI